MEPLKRVEEQCATLSTEGEALRVEAEALKAERDELMGFKDKFKAEHSGVRTEAKALSTEVGRLKKKNAMLIEERDAQGLKATAQRARLEVIVPHVFLWVLLCWCCDDVVLVLCKCCFGWQALVGELAARVAVVLSERGELVAEVSVQCV